MIRQGPEADTGPDREADTEHDTGPDTEHDTGPDRERGAGTVLLLGVVAVVLMLGLALAALGAAQRARGTAQAAADLGALAGATAVRHGLDGCVTARQTVQRNGGVLVGCDREAGGIVTVRVTRASAVLPGWPAGDAQAGARAGPRAADDGQRH